MSSMVRASIKAARWDDPTADCTEGRKSGALMPCRFPSTIPFHCQTSRLVGRISLTKGGG